MNSCMYCTLWDIIKGRSEDSAISKWVSRVLTRKIKWTKSNEDLSEDWKRRGRQI